VPERHSVVAGAGPNVFTSQHVHILSHKTPKPCPPSSSTSTKLKPESHSRKRTFDLPLSIRLGYLPCPGTNVRILSKPPVPMDEKMPSLIQKGNADEESDSSDSFKSLEISLHSSHGGSCSSEVGSALPHRASSVLEQNLLSWRVNLNGNEELSGAKSENRRPSSVDLEARPLTSRRRFLAKYFTVRKEGKTESDELILESVESKPMPELDQAHFHLYQSHSVFLNELFLYWDRQVLVRQSIIIIINQGCIFQNRNSLN